MRKVILPRRAMVEVTVNREEKEDTAGCADATVSSKNVGGEKMETVMSEGRDPRKKRTRDGGQEPASSAGKENIRSPFIFINKTSRRVKKRAGTRTPGTEESEQPSRRGEARGKTGKKRDRCGVDSNGRATGSRRGGLRLFLNNNEMQSS